MTDNEPVPKVEKKIKESSFAVYKTAPKWMKSAASIVFVVGVFAFGVLVGNGNIDIALGQVPASKESASLPNDLDYSSVEQAYDVLKRNFDGSVSNDQILDGIKEGLAKSTGDPYTDYFNAKDSEEFNSQLNGTFEGIGAELGKDKESIIVVSPLSGYPAEKAGLRPKDIIAKIDGESTYDMSINDAVKKIRGQKDTQVKLTIVREGKDPFEVTITRAKISIPSVESKVENGIGYIKISQFGSDTVELTEKTAKDFKAQSVKGIVLDLRGNPGGYLDAAVKISSLWLDEGKTIVVEKRGGEVLKTDKSNGNNILSGIPTVVLIDAGSASASEITAGALKDNGVAKLVGAKSFGKGSVQQIVPLGAGGSLKVTIARWFTPNGRNIDKEGIVPDIAVERTDDDYKNNRDPQKDRAFETVIKN